MGKLVDKEDLDRLKRIGHRDGLRAALEAVTEDASRASSLDGRTTEGRRRPGLWYAVATIERLIEAEKGDDGE